MKRIISLLLILLSINTITATSKFTLCAYVDKKSGETLGFFQTWAIEKNGSDIFLYYKSDSPLQSNYTIKIERIENRNDTSYTVIDEIKISPKYIDSSWMAKRYEFNKPGNYRFTLLDSTNTTTLECYTTSLRYLDNEYMNDSALDTWYYKNVSLKFCDSVWSEILIRKNDQFNTGKDFVAYVAHDDEKQLRTSKIIVKIYSLNEAKTLKTTKEYDINYHQRWTTIPFNFSEKGKYIIELYSDKNIFIQNKIVDIY